MTGDTPSLERKLKATAETIESLVDKANRGLIRVPSFQRGIKWERKDSEKLLDSVYHGYPIGVLLLWEQKAQAERIRLGDLRIDAPETPAAWFVVDGQQRLTTLAASLTRRSGERDPQFDLVFDPEARRFAGRSTASHSPFALPVCDLLDATELSERMHEQPFRDAPEVRRVVFEAGRRIREYTVPLYVVPAMDEEILKEVFYRINDAGKKLEWPDVHAALFGTKGPKPSTVRDLADDLVLLGMGRPDEHRLLRAMLSSAGLDPTRPPREHIDRDRETVARAAEVAAPALRRSMAFLRERCHVPHLRLLPHWEVLHVLARFFAVHAEPEDRTLELLKRVAWRGPLTGTYGLDRRTFLRRAVDSVQANEVDTIESLLRLVPTEPASRFEMDATFDARNANSKLCLLAMAALRPRHLQTGHPMALADLIEEQDVQAFHPIVAKGANTVVRSPANRMLHAPGVPSWDELRRLASADDGAAVLQSHAVSGDALASVLADDPTTFVQARAKALVEAVERLHRWGAEWGRSDRPAISHLIDRTSAT